MIFIVIAAAVRVAARDYAHHLIICTLFKNFLFQLTSNTPFLTCFQISTPLSPFSILITNDCRLNKYVPFSDTETTALLFPPLAEERYPRIPLLVSYHQDMETATLI